MAYPARRDIIKGLAATAVLAGRTTQAASDSNVETWRHYAPSRDGQVHYLSARPTGEDLPLETPLVCLHQSPMSGGVFREFLTVMATDREVHCPDTPGFGASDRPDGKPTIQDYALGIADSLEALGYGVNDPVDLYGFHTGSLVATELTLARPKMVRRIILIGVPYYPANERAAMEARFVGSYGFLTDPNYVPDMFRRMVVEADNAFTPQQRLSNFVDRMRAGPRGKDGPDAVWSYDADARLKALADLDKDILFLAFNEVLTEPSKLARRLYFPEAPLIELSDLPMEGHRIGPEMVADAIRPFLDS